MARQRIRPRPSRSLHSAALSGALGAVSVHKYHSSLLKKLAKSKALAKPGALHGSSAESDLSELLGDKVGSKSIAEEVLDVFPDLCSANPKILSESVSALTSNIALGACGQALDLHVGEISNKEDAADIVESLAGTLDAEGHAQARAFVVELLGPLIGSTVTAALRHHERKSTCTAERENSPTFTVREARLPVARPLCEEGPSSTCAHSTCNAENTLPENDCQSTPTPSQNTTPSQSRSTTASKGLKRSREEVDGSVEEPSRTGEDRLHRLPLRVEIGSRISNVEPPQKKRKHDEDSALRRPAQRQSSDRTRYSSTPRSVSPLIASSSPVESPRPRIMHHLWQLTVNVASQAFRSLPLPILDTILSAPPHADAVLYGGKIDHKMGYYNLQYILMSAIYKLHKVDTLCAYGATSLLAGLSSKEVMSHAAYAFGLSRSRYDNKEEVLLAAIGRASYHLSTEELRETVLFAYEPAIRAALAAVVAVLRPPQLCAKSLEPRRAHVRKLLALHAEGEPYDSGLTPFEKLLSTNDTTVSAMLRSDLLEDLEILK